MVDDITSQADAYKKYKSENLKSASANILELNSEFDSVSKAIGEDSAD